MVAPKYQKVVIVGATGKLGQFIARAFLDRKDLFDVYLLVRPQTLKGTEKADLINDFRMKGARLVENPLTDAKSLLPSIKGMDLFVSVVGDAAIGEQAWMIEAAKEAKIKRFVPSEFALDPDNAPFKEFSGKKEEIANLLAQSGLEYLRLSCGLFMDLLLSPAFGWNVRSLADFKATLYGSEANQIALTHRLDVGNALVELSQLPKWPNGKVKLAGDQLSQAELLTKFASALGPNPSHPANLPPPEVKTAAPKEAPSAPLVKQLPWLLTQDAGSLGKLHNDQVPQLRMMTVDEYAKRLKRGDKGI